MHCNIVSLLQDCLPWCFEDIFHYKQRNTVHATLRGERGKEEMEMLQENKNKETFLINSQKKITTRCRYVSLFIVHRCVE